MQFKAGGMDPAAQTVYKRLASMISVVLHHNGMYLVSLELLIAQINNPLHP